MQEQESAIRRVWVMESALRDRLAVKVGHDVYDWALKDSVKQKLTSVCSVPGVGGVGGHTHVSSSHLLQPQGPLLWCVGGTWSWGTRQHIREVQEGRASVDVCCVTVSCLLLQREGSWGRKGRGAVRKGELGVGPREPGRQQLALSLPCKDSRRRGMWGSAQALSPPTPPPVRQTWV